MTLTAQTDVVVEYLDAIAAELVETEGECEWCGDFVLTGEAFCDSHCRLAKWRSERANP